MEVEAGRIVNSAEEELPQGMPGRRAIHLAGSGVQELICGAVSRQLESMLEACGIRVISFVTGDLEEIIPAWLAGNLEHRRYIMPGCRGRRAQRSALAREGGFMRGKNRGGSGLGAGQAGGGGTRARQGGGGGRRASGTNGSCVCPKCGHRLVHQRGVPCFEQSCPECGTAMIRE